AGITPSRSSGTARASSPRSGRRAFLRHHRWRPLVDRRLRASAHDPRRRGQLLVLPASLERASASPRRPRRDRARPRLHPSAPTPTARVTLVDTSVWGRPLPPAERETGGPPRSRRRGGPSLGRRGARARPPPTPALAPRAPR